MNTITSPGINSPVVIDEELLHLPMEEGQVAIHINHHSCFSSCIGSSICSVSVNPNAYLQPNNISTRSLLVHTVNIETDDKNISIRKEVKKFSLIFSGLPKNAASFDFIEPCSTGWRLLNINRNKSDVYKLQIHKGIVKLIE